MSQIDHILVLRVLTEHRQEFQQGLLAASAKHSIQLIRMPSGRLFCGVPSTPINLMSDLYYAAESAVRCVDTISDLFPIVARAHQGCALAPTLFSVCMDWILGRMSERSICDASFGNVNISNLDFTDDAVMFAETLDILLGALAVMIEESEPLVSWVSWVKT